MCCLHACRGHGCASLHFNSWWPSDTYIYVSWLTIIGSDNRLSPGQRQAIVWTIAGILLTGPLGTNNCEILIQILAFSFTKMRLEASSDKKWRSFRRGLNVINNIMSGLWFVPGVTKTTNRQLVLDNRWWICVVDADQSFNSVVCHKNEMRKMRCHEN